MPEKFQNKTNGVTQRRWLAFCNPRERDLITEALGSDEWIGDLYKLTGLREKADDPEFKAKWAAMKRACKEDLAVLVKEKTGYEISPDAMFDIQVGNTDNNPVTNEKNGTTRPRTSINKALVWLPEHDSQLLTIDTLSQVKRIHEYKRQLLNVMRCIDAYTKIKAMSAEEKSKLTPKVIIIGGKAAPGYAMAKKIIKLINAVGAK
eukprot:2062632-Pyramimonas_sp.AAC.1